MGKFEVIIYEECEPIANEENPHYADSSRSIFLEFRPLVGDIYITENPSLAPVKGYKVDSLIYCGNNIFHAYCSVIKADESYGGYYGRKNMEGTLLAHTIDQMKDFPEIYQKDPD